MRLPNTYAATTPIGQAISNMGAALFSGPTPAEQAETAANLEYRKALTEQALAETRLKQTEQGGYTDWAQIMQQLAVPQELPRPDAGAVGPQPMMPRDQQLQAAMPDILTSAMQIDPAQIGKIAQALMANMGGTDDQVVRSMAGAGNALGVDQAVSLGGQENVASRNQGYAVDLNNADNVASAMRQAMADSAALDRQSRLPVGTSAGETTTFFPGDARAPSGSVQGVPTETIVKGGILANLPPELQAMAAGPSETQVNAQTIMSLSPEDQRIAAIGRDSDGGTPLTVEGDNLNDAWTGIALQFDGATTTEGGKTVIADEFWSALANGGVDRQAVEEVMAAEFQRTRDIAKAQRAGLAAMGIGGAEFSDGGFFGDPAFSTPEDAPDALPAPAQEAAPAAPVHEGGTVIQNGWIYRMQNGRMEPVGPVS